MKILLFMLAGLCGSDLFSTPTTKLDGTITDGKTGKYLEGAKVEIFVGANFLKEAITNSVGTYRIRLYPGTYNMKMTHRDYLTAEIKDLRVRNGDLNWFCCALYTDTILTDLALQSPLLTYPDDFEVRQLPSQQTSKDRYYEGPRVRRIGTDGPAMYAPYFMDLLVLETMESYIPVRESYFIRPKEKAVSSFPVDIGGVSYTNMRRFLQAGGWVPQEEGVRVEEFINYFEYDYDAPKDGKPFAVYTELVKCPWNPDHDLLSIGLQGQKTETEPVACNLIFLVDMSRSLSEPNKLLLAQLALQQLTRYLRPQDQITILNYADVLRRILPLTPGNEHESIQQAIRWLYAGDTTVDATGLRVAYQLAGANFIERGNNRVIFCTDGDFYLDAGEEKELMRLIETNRDKGIYLSVLDFGNAKEMQELAEIGKGNYAYIDDLSKAERALIRECKGTFFNIAKDVKIELEFNPEKMAAYRLVGYEDSVQNRENATNDAPNAGKLNVGHQVTALYEIVPIGQSIPDVGKNKSINYQQTEAGRVSKGGDLVTIKLHYKKPKGMASRQVIQKVVPYRHTENISPNLALATAAASFGMVLRNSVYKGNATLQSALLLARSAARYDPSGQVAKLCLLIKKAEDYIAATSQ